MRPVARLAVRRVLLGGWRTAIEVAIVALAVAAVALLLGSRPVITGPAQDVVGPVAAGATLVVVALALAAGEQERAAAAAVLVCNGGARSHRRAARVLEGLVLGGLGTAAGVVAAAVLRPALGSAQELGPVVVSAAVGAVATVAASVWGSRQAVRTPVPELVVARRPARPVRPAGVALAAASVVVGMVIASSSRSWFDMPLCVLPGGFLVAVGAAHLAATALALLGPVARRARGGMRLATVGLARERYRTGPAVALVTVVCGVAFVAALFGSSFDLREERRIAALGHKPWARTLNDDQLLVESPDLFGSTLGPGFLPKDLARQLAADLPAGAVVATVRGASPPGTAPFAAVVTAARPRDVPDDNGPTSVAVGDQPLLRALGLDPAAGRQLAAGRALVLDPALEARGEVILEEGSDGRSFSVPAVVTGVDRARSDLPGVVLPPGVLDERGLQPTAHGTLVRVPGGITPPVRRQVEDRLRQAQARPPDPVTHVPPLVLTQIIEPGPAEAWADGRLDAGELIPDEHAVRVFAATALVLGVAMITFALALSTVERRRDDELLVVLGARAGLRRVVGGVQAAVLAVVGAAVAVVLGTGATAFGFATYNGAHTGPPPIPFVFPWTVALVLLIGLPVVAAGLTSVLTPTIRAVDLPRLAD
jgi:putative ABC transport system permease protein